MSRTDSSENSSGKFSRSSEALAELVIRVAEAARVDAIICATEAGDFARRLDRLTDQHRIIAATPNGETYNDLSQTELEVIRLPLHAADKYKQTRYVLSVVLKSRKISIGDLVVCAMDRQVYPEEGALVVLAEADPTLEHIAVSDLFKLTDGIRPQALESTIVVAGKIGRAARRGKRIGAIFTLGDSVSVLEKSKQLVPNPFRGHKEPKRRLTNPETHEALVELAKLDGAFVVRGDGLIQTAGTLLTASPDEVKLPAGLGARHAIGAAISKRTKATSVVVSATDGNVRVFSGGEMILQMDPDMAHGHITLQD